MGDELKACPFCGAAGVSWRGPEKGNACCPSDELPCGAVFYDVADWNRRPVEDALTARAEAAEQRAEAAEAEVSRLRGAWADAVAEVSAMGTEPDLGGLALTPRRSPATMKALREVARMLAEAQPAEVADV